VRSSRGASRGIEWAGGGRRALLALTAAWLIAAPAGFGVGQAMLPGAITTASFLVLGVFIAVDRQLRQRR